MKLNARQLREADEKTIAEKARSLKRQEIYFILENIYDTYNIGGLFRLADALAIEKIYICGESEIPPNHKIRKASIGTYKVVPWEYYKTAAEVISNLKSQTSKPQLKSKKLGSGGTGAVEEEQSDGKTAPVNEKRVKIIAVEQHPKAINFTDSVYSLPLALIFGNETSGVTEETLRLADQIVEIPMFGINRSLNVIVSAAIVSYYIVMTNL